MFFLREVFIATAGVRQVGSHCSDDLMTAHLASQAGYTGEMLRGPKVYPDYGRKTNTPEAKRAKDLYARIDGAYFAQLAAFGNKDFFQYWHNQLLEVRDASGLR